MGQGRGGEHSEAMEVPVFYLLLCFAAISFPPLPFAYFLFVAVVGTKRN